MGSPRYQPIGRGTPRNLVVYILGACLVVLLLKLGQQMSNSSSYAAQQHWMNYHHPAVQHPVMLAVAAPPAANCEPKQLSAAVPASACKVKREYRPSLLEQQWLNNAAIYQDSFCDSLGPFENSTKVWLQTLAIHNQLQLVKSNKSPAQALVEHQKMDPLVFSSYKTTYDCGTGSISEQITWIEPLSHGLRHPNALCNRGAHIKDRGYLLVEHQSDIQTARQLGNVQCQNRTCQAIYFDLGASILQVGPSEAGQGWFYDAYHRQGVDFDRYLLWEAGSQSPSLVFKNVPKADLHKYQYYNIPVSPDVNDPSNPVAILKTIAQPGDFVVFKLDIDNPEIEDAIMLGLQSDPEALALVDEFYFEEHVNFKEMALFWGAGGQWRHSLDPRKTLATSYQNFYKLRQAGVRAHSWV